MGASQGWVRRVFDVSLGNLYLVFSALQTMTINAPTDILPYRSPKLPDFQHKFQKTERLRTGGELLHSLHSVKLMCHKESEREKKKSNFHI